MISTSNFARCGRNPNAVAISSGYPKGWYGRKFQKLAPAHNMLKAGKEDFDKYYYARLAELDARKVYDEIVGRFGQDAILLCWESPNIRCHRRIVAEWFETELGIVVPEFGFERGKIIPYSEMLDKGEKPVPKKEAVQLALFDDLF